MRARRIFQNFEISTENFQKMRFSLKNFSRSSAIEPRTCSLNMSEHVRRTFVVDFSIFSARFVKDLVEISIFDLKIFGFFCCCGFLQWLGQWKVRLLSKFELLRSFAKFMKRFLNVFEACFSLLSTVWTVTFRKNAWQIWQNWFGSSYLETSQNFICSH